MPEIVDGKEDNERENSETMTHNMGLKMGVAVHCHECWRYTDTINYQRDLVRLAVDVIQSSGITNKECYIEANIFLANAFRNGVAAYIKHEDAEKLL